MILSVKNIKYAGLILLIVLLVISKGNDGYALPVNERTQAVREAIVAAVDGINAAADVTDAHLAAITELNLRNKGITALKSGDFNGLTGLTGLNLYNNELGSLPDGIFEGLTALTTLRLGSNTVDPMLISVSLEKVSDGQFKVVVPTGAPFAIVVPISAMNGGISGDTTTVTVAKGSVESNTLTVIRTEGTTMDVTVDIGSLPGLPDNHYGYALSKSDTTWVIVISETVPPETPLVVNPTPTPPDPVNSAPTFTDGDSAVRSIFENTDAGTPIGVAVTATDANSEDTLTYTLSGIDAESFDIDATTGQLKTKVALDYETKRVYVVSITVSDGSLSDTITVLINVIDKAETTVVTTVLVPVSARTPSVRDAIVTAVPDVTSATAITETHLAAITELNLRSQGISALKPGDFSGLTALTNLNLYGNMLSSLPMGIFEGLTALTTLRLGDNLVSPMPLIVSLQQVDASQYQVIVPAGAPFDVVLSVDTTMVTVPKGSVKSDTFTAVGIPEIGALPMLPANHFGYVLSKSTTCNRTAQVSEAIAAAVPGITDCRNVSEVDLAGITSLDLSSKSITLLQANDFTGMLLLTTLNLSNNQLSSFPDGIFAGLTSLSSLELSGNTVDPLPLVISLIKVGENQIKAVLPTGTPFAITLPVLVKIGDFASSTVMLTIPQGSIESELQTVTRTAGTTATVSVDIGMLPNLPPMHSGYTFVKANNLPLEVLEDINVAPVFTDGSSTTRSVPENTASGVNIGSAVAATDVNNDILTYTLSGTDAAAFDIVSTSGQIQTKTSLDFETKSKYQVMMTVSDGTLTDTITVTINVTDKPEQQPKDETEPVTPKNSVPVFTEGVSATRFIAENTGAGVDIGSAVSAMDADSGDTLTYSLGGINAGSFTVDSTSGQLRTSAALNYEAKNTYTVEVTVSDGTDTDTITVTINVTDVDEAPVNVSPVFTEGNSTKRSVAENTGAGVDIGPAVSATDVNDDILTYSLGGDNASAFSIDSTTGQLRTSDELDYETTTSYSVTITVSDGKGGSDSINVSINVTDIVETPANNSPVFTEGENTRRSVAENTGSGVDIGSAVGATDADNDILTYGLIGTDAASFGIDSSSGQLRTSASLDYETTTSYSVTITVSDGKGGSDSINVSINVTDIVETPANNSPVFTEGENTRRSVAENTGSGVDIGSAVGATDADNDILTYGLIGTDAASFGIDSSSGQLRTSASLDYETTTSYSVTITVSDGKGGSDSINVSINITDVDETPVNNPPVFSEGDSTTRTIVENTASGLDIGSAITATDADNDTLTYSLGGTDASTFSIVSTTGQLKTSAELDFEDEDTYSVIVFVSDGEGSSDSINVTINVTNINEAPTFTDGDSTTRSIAENAPAGVNIGAAVAATDDDRDTLTYTLSGTNATLFDIDSAIGQLKTKAALDYETPPNTYSVTVSVSDNNGGTDSITVTINVTDLDETPSNNPPVITAGAGPITRAVTENMAAGTNVGVAVAATDADGNTLAYLLSGDDASAFSINSDGQLKTSAVLNHEVKSSYSVTITVSDGSATDSIVVSISVTDANDAPIFNKNLPTTLSIAENRAATNIGDPFTAIDEDADDTLTYSLDEDTDATLFSIDGTGQLRTLKPLDYETATSYQLTITVSDGQGGSDEVDITITVTDVNENVAPAFTEGDDTIRSVAENTGSGVNIGTPVSATDANSDDTLTYSLGGTDAASFSINTSNGQLQTQKALDYETKDTYSVEITVRDGNGGSASITVTINVTDVDENVAPTFTDGVSTTRSVAENTGSGANIGDPVSATDANSDDTLTYSLGGTDAASFSINTSNGQLRTLAALDFETKDTYSVTITVRDGKGGSASIDVSISVTDVDENVAPVFTEGDDTTRSVAENTGSGVNIGTPVSATDENNGDTLTYSLSGTDAASFSINTSNGQLRTLAALDFETKDTYSVTITVRDGKGGSASIDVSISVADVDENVAPVFSEGDDTTRFVAENTGSGVNIGTPVSATDENSGDTLTYSLSGTDTTSFRINSTNGQLRTHAALDYETLPNVYSVTVSVSDGKGGSDSINVTINVTDVDENIAPIFTDGGSTSRSVAENTEAGQNIGSAVAATDANDDTLTYSLGGTDAASFDIISTSGQLQTHAALDYETPPNAYSVTVSVSDGKGGSDSITVTINVTDVDENNPPMFTQDSVTLSILIDSNTAAGDNIGDPVVATDLDEDILTYSLSGNHASFFSIDSSSGQLKIIAALLSDTSATYSINVIADDGNGGTDSIAVMVRVAGRILPQQQVVNNAPIVDTDSPNVSIEVPEGMQNSAFEVTITFTETVSGFEQSDVSLTGTATASITAWSANTDNTVFTATVTPTTSGTVTLNIAASVATDAANNPNTAATSQTVNVDMNAPSVSVTVPSGDQTGAFDVTITFTEAVSDFEQSDLTLTGTATASITSWSTTDNITYTATITPTTSGTVTFSVPSGVATDAASNDNTASDSQTVTVTVEAETVWMPDDALRNAVRNALGLEDDEVLTKVKMLELTRLYYSVNIQNQMIKGRINNLTGVEYATNLTSLDLYGNSISDLSPLSDLTNLTRLHLIENSISDLSPLSGLTSLTELILPRNPISDVSPLKSLTSLTVLRLQNNTISDLSPLSGLTSLTELSLSDNTISDVSPLSGLTSLTRLYLDNKYKGYYLGGDNTISDVSPLKGLTNLTKLSLKENLISDVSPLKGLTNLRSLSLKRNPILDTSPLYPLLAANGGTITSIDIIVSKYRPWDVNRGGRVDANDVALVTAALGQTVNFCYFIREDVNCDGVVDNEDLRLVTENLDPAETAPDSTEWMPDENLTRRVKGWLDMGTDYTLTKAKMLELPTKVFLNHHKNIEDITGLEYATNLTHLYLNQNLISDLSPLSGLTSLTFLALGGNSISDVSPLKGLTSLRGLTLGGNSISDLSPLKGLTSLRGLYLEDNSISDVSPLSGLTSLTNLELNGNSISDVSPLSNLTSLTNLELNGNSISDVSPLSNLTSLTKLYLAENPILDTSLLYPLLAANGGTITSIDIDVSEHPPWDVNEDGSVDATDSVLVTAALGQTGEDIVNPRTDVNGDGTVDNDDLTLVTDNLDTNGDAPSNSGVLALLDRATLEKMDPETLAEQLDILRAESDGSLRYLRAIALLENILAVLRPEQTVLLANYPNPFNPETWIPYQLANPSDVVITIYDMRGVVARRLDLGHQLAGYYTTRSRAAYWDGRNELDERVASGIYFYQLTADNTSLLRKMLILK